MRKIILLIALIFTSFLSAQRIGADVIKFSGKVTTAVRDGLNVPTGETWLIYNVTTLQFEKGDDNGNWEPFTGAGDGDVVSVNGKVGEVVLNPDDLSDASSSNKFITASLLAKLETIETGAQVNVQSDWDATSGAAWILNKPILGALAQKDNISASDILGEGINGQVLTTNGAGEVTWKNPSGGANSLLTRGTGLLGDNYDGTTPTTWSLDSAYTGLTKYLRNTTDTFLGNLIINNTTVGNANAIVLQGVNSTNWIKYNKANGVLNGLIGMTDSGQVMFVSYTNGQSTIIQNKAGADGFLFDYGEGNKKIWNEGNLDPFTESEADTKFLPLINAKADDNEVVKTQSGSPVQNINAWMGNKAQYKANPPTSGLVVITDSIPAWGGGAGNALLTRGAGLTGSNYNGTTPSTWAIDPNYTGFDNKYIKSTGNESISGIKTFNTPMQFFVNSINSTSIRLTDAGSGVSQKLSTSATPPNSEIGYGITRFNSAGDFMINSSIGSSDSKSIKFKFGNTSVGNFNYTYTFQERDGTVAMLDDIAAAGGGDMLKSENLSGLADYTTARTNLGLGGLATKSTIANSDITDGAVSSAKLANTAVTPGTYANATITVNNKGQVTFAKEGLLYAQGNWTPEPYASGSGTPTVHSATGVYNRVGNVVFISGKVTFSMTGGTGELRIRGLPFEAFNHFGSVTMGDYKNLGTSELPGLSGAFGSVGGNYYIYFHHDGIISGQAANTDGNALQATSSFTNSVMHFSGTYRTEGYTP